ncbi:hypothetical protein D3C78_1181720 [compost metagenome]
MPGFIARQLGQEQVIRLHPKRGRHQFLRPHPAAVQQMDMVRVQRQLQLVYLLDGDQPALNGVQIDQRLAEGGFAGARAPEDDDVLPMLNGQREERIPVAIAVCLLHGTLPVLQLDGGRGHRPRLGKSPALDVIIEGEAIQGGLADRDRARPALAGRRHHDQRPLTIRQFQSLDR